MFDGLNCSDDAQAQGVTCGMFGSEKPKMTKPPTLTLTDLLKKLDLAEYEAKFNAAGIYDARAPRRKRPRALVRPPLRSCGRDGEPRPARRCRRSRG